MAHQDTRTPSISSYLAVTWQLLGRYLTKKKKPKLIELLFTKQNTKFYFF